MEIRVTLIFLLLTLWNGKIYEELSIILCFRDVLDRKTIYNQDQNKDKLLSIYDGDND